MTNIQNHVTSLELSKRLKGLGVPQDSLFYWRLSYHTSESFDKSVSLGKKGEFGDYRIQLLPYPRLTTADVKWNDSDLAHLDETEVSAFLVSELGEIIPNTLKGYRFKIAPNTCQNKWWAGYMHYDTEMFGKGADTLSDALANLLCHLLKNGLITINDANK